MTPYITAINGDGLRRVFAKYIKDRRNIEKVLSLQGLHKVKSLDISVTKPLKNLKIGLITPPRSAAIGDVKSAIAKKLYRGYRDIFYPTIVEYEIYFTAKGFNSGHNSKQIDQAIKDGVDSIIIARGGGDISQLMLIDNLQFAESICKSTIPIHLAIGHYKDKSILDNKVTKSHATPSAVGEYFGEIIKKSMYSNHKSNSNIPKDDKRARNINRSKSKYHYGINIVVLVFILILVYFIFS